MSNIIRRWLWRAKWNLKQRLAGDSRYYGDGGTIHHTGQLDIETFHGTVVAVWFRCQPLPFHQHLVGGLRATNMERMYGDEKHALNLSITGVEIYDWNRD